MENQQNSKEVTNLKSQRNLYLILTIVLFLVSSVSIWKLVNTSKTLDKTSVQKEEVNKEKEDLLVKLGELNDKYTKLNSEHEGLGELFQKEKEEVERLMNEVKNSKGNISHYKAMVAKLEQRMKDYEAKIAELQMKNEELTVENVNVKEALNVANNQNAELSKNNDDLNQKVQISSVLKAYDFTTETLRVRRNGKEIPTKNIKRVDIIRACFILSENKIIPSGKKTVFLRISDPDGIVITESAEDANAFEFQGKKILYSSKTDVNYENKAIDVCMTWEKPRKYKSGNYLVDLFVDGQNIGSTTFKLEE